MNVDSRQYGSSEMNHVLTKAIPYYSIKNVFEFGFFGLFFFPKKKKRQKDKVKNKERKFYGRVLTGSGGGISMHANI